MRNLHSIKPTTTTMMQQSKGLSVYVDNLSYETTEEAIEQMFNQTGQVTNVRIVTDRETGRPKCFDFCEITDKAGAHHRNAVNSFNGMDFNGRSLRVNFASKD
ncbi:unnamed protein product [Heligmosomoides polygyrus]|uniref:RRM domain-containing protein n=1 Tax=Heligmosomoides polygyrus TaxID=6339 RepID=A0A3P8B107_HELPZ|nr:unnamed protein product [Heligmosomoides polygyrus]